MMTVVDNNFMIKNRIDAKQGDVLFWISCSSAFFIIKPFLSNTFIY